MKAATLTALEQFALTVLNESRIELCDLDGGWIQDKAEELGLLVRVPVTEPCGEDCVCDMPGDCLRFSPEVIVLLRETEK